MALWHVMKKYKENDVYYQVLPYDTRVIYDLATVRETAKAFGISKSTVHAVVTIWNG